MKYDNPDAAVEMFCAIILEKARQCIPMTHISERKGSHPWLDEHCLEAIRHKHASQGSDSYEAAARACTDAISAAYRKYIEKKKSDFKSLRRGSKQWWAIAKTLMDGATKTAGIPYLKQASGTGYTRRGGKPMLLLTCCRVNLSFPQICILKLFLLELRRHKCAVPF